MIARFIAFARIVACPTVLVGAQQINASIPTTRTVGTTYTTPLLAKLTIVANATTKAAVLSVKQQLDTTLSTKRRPLGTTTIPILTNMTILT
jgi:hypothetical protein